MSDASHMEQFILSSNVGLQNSFARKVMDSSEFMLSRAVDHMFPMDFTEPEELVGLPSWFVCMQIR